MAGISAAMLVVGALAWFFALSDWEFQIPLLNMVFPILALGLSFFVPRAGDPGSARRSVAVVVSCLPALVAATLLAFGAMLQLGLGTLPPPTDFLFGPKPRRIVEISSRDGSHTASAWALTVPRPSALEVTVTDRDLPLLRRVVYRQQEAIDPQHAVRWPDDHTLVVGAADQLVDLRVSAFHWPQLITIPRDWLRAARPGQ